MIAKILVQIHWDEKHTRFNSYLPNGTTEAEIIRRWLREAGEGIGIQLTEGKYPTVTAIVEP